MTNYQTESLIRRVVDAYRDGRLVSGIARRLWGEPGEPALRDSLGLPNASDFENPTIITSGDFFSKEARAVKASLQAAIDGKSKLPPSVCNITGMSGQRYRTFINTLLETLDRSRYLEIGSWLGSTAASAIYANRVQALCIDNWSEFSGSKEKFLENMHKAKSESADFHLIEQDFRHVNYHAIGEYNVYLFDGPPSEADHVAGITLAQPSLSDRFVLIVDDWNWPGVRKGTMRGLLAARCLIEASVQVRTTLDNTHPIKASGTSDWHNGYLIAVVSKRQKAWRRFWSWLGSSETEQLVRRAALIVA